MLLITVVCSLVYGVVTGTFSGGTQLWAAPIKIAGGLLISAAICLPSLYIFTCLSGSQGAFRGSLRTSGRFADADDYLAHWLCARWPGFFLSPRIPWPGWGHCTLSFGVLPRPLVFDS